MRNTMTQYQNVYDAFMRCDTDKLAEEFAALYDESKKDAEKRLEAAQKVIHASYERIREQYLTPCYEDLLAGRNADCKTRYVQMVRDLERKYLN